MRCCMAVGDVRAQEVRFRRVISRVCTRKDGNIWHGICSESAFILITIKDDSEMRAPSYMLWYCMLQELYLRNQSVQAAVWSLLQPLNKLELTTTDDCWLSRLSANVRLTLSVCWYPHQVQERCFTHATLIWRIRRHQPRAIRAFHTSRDAHRDRAPSKTWHSQSSPPSCADKSQFLARKRWSREGLGSTAAYSSPRQRRAADSARGTSRTPSLALESSAATSRWRARGRPGVLVGPEEELVAHPRQHRDRRVVHADAQGHGPLALYRGVAGVVVHAVQCSVETMPFARGVFGLSIREVWLCHCHLWNLAPASRQGWCGLTMFWCTALTCSGWRRPSVRAISEP